MCVYVRAHVSSCVFMIQLQFRLARFLRQYSSETRIVRNQPMSKELAPTNASLTHSCHTHYAEGCNCRWMPSFQLSTTGDRVLTNVPGFDLFRMTILITVGLLKYI